MRKLVPAAAVLVLVGTAVLPAQRRRQTFPTDAPWLHLGLDREIDWIRDPEVFVDDRRPKRSLSEDVDRGAMMDEAIARAQRETKLVLWYVYRVVESTSRGRQMYRAPILDTYMQQVLFADPDVSALVRTNFVPLRMVCDEAMSARFGLRPLDFIEPAIVFVNGEGKAVHVVERIRTFDAQWFADLLRRVGEQHNAHISEGRDPVGEGIWEAWLAFLDSKDDRTPRDGYEAATFLRRLRRPDEALERLQAIAPGDAALDADVRTERGLILTLQGRTGEAIEALRAAFDIPGARAAEAGYLLAWNTLMTGREAEAMRIYGKVAESAPDSVWGRRARANLMVGNDERPVGAAFAGFEHFGYLTEAAYQGLPRDTSWPGASPAPRDMARAAVAYLLAQQRESGGFTDCRYAYWGTPRITPNAWVAITALAATALLEFRDLDPQRIDRAVLRAEDYMFDPSRLNRGDNEDVYADAYRLVYLSRKQAAAGEGGDPAHQAARAAIVARMNGIIDEARQRQHETGFWAHEYRNAFCTAAMVWGLLLARDAGATVPEEMLDRAAGALLSARFENGAFSYGGTARQGREGSLKDASGRMPACEGALYALQRSDLEKLGKAFGAFWEFSDRLENVRRNDFHSDGELAGFFWFHDLFHTSEALQLLPPQERDAHRAKLLALLQRIPEVDGSFVDSHEIGRSYGTAMALLTLANVAE